jgi:hypothetical protein
VAVSRWPEQTVQTQFLAPLRLLAVVAVEQLGLILQQVVLLVALAAVAILVVLAALELQTKVLPVVILVEILLAPAVEAQVKLATLTAQVVMVLLLL